MDDREMTERILGIFDEINAVPRRSGDLERIHRHLTERAAGLGFDTESDEARNLLIRVPASRGFEKAPVIVLQGHMDMVCEKRPGVKHDFHTDPIVSRRDGEWLRAEGTSLGADNGIALAMAFELISDPRAEHPELEILITADEEVGLVGAQKLRPGFLKGRVLINLDSEDEGVFTVGCAGGMDTNISFPISREAIPAGFEPRKPAVSGLEGGHSGAEIQEGRANANVLLVRVLHAVLDALPEARLGELSGGSAHNAIPREAEGLMAVPFSDLGKLESLIAGLHETLRIEYAGIEKNLQLTLERASIPAGGLFTPGDGRRIVDALRLIPHGVKAMSARIEGSVELSTNFAVLQTEENQVKALTNTRSAVMSRGHDSSETMFSLARLYGGIAESGNHYPPWEPRGASDLLDRCRSLWQRLHAGEAKTELTHGGLECGAIGANYPQMDMISFGPTIRQPHSPDERLHIPSAGRMQHFLRELLKGYR